MSQNEGRHGHHGHHHGEQRYDAPQQQTYGGYPGSNPGYNAAPYGQAFAATNGGGYPQQPGNGGYENEQSASYGAVLPSSAANDISIQAQKHKRNEHIGELAALGAGVFERYEHHEVKSDAEHAGRHHKEDSVAQAVALGAGGYALYEHHEVRQDHKLEGPASSDQGHKKHHLLK